MERQEIFDKVKSLIAEKTMIEDINEESTLSFDLCLDSLDQVELMMDAEKEFEVTIPDDDMVGFKVVKDIVDYIVEKKQ